MHPKRRALLAKWEVVLKRNGLGLQRGRLGGKLSYVGSSTNLEDLDTQRVVPGKPHVSSPRLPTPPAEPFSAVRVSDGNGLPLRVLDVEKLRTRPLLPPLSSNGNTTAWALQQKAELPRLDAERAAWDASPLPSDRALDLESNRHPRRHPSPRS